MRVRLAMEDGTLYPPKDSKDEDGYELYLTYNAYHLDSKLTANGSIDVCTPRTHRVHLRDAVWRPLEAAPQDGA